MKRVSMDWGESEMGEIKIFDEQKEGVKMWNAICVGFKYFGFALNWLKLVLRLFENKSEEFLHEIEWT
jgi:hypothetical protein